MPSLYARRNLCKLCGNGLKSLHYTKAMTSLRHVVCSMWLFPTSHDQERCIQRQHGILYIYNKLCSVGLIIGGLVNIFETTENERTDARGGKCRRMGYIGSEENNTDGNIQKCVVCLGAVQRMQKLGLRRKYYRTARCFKDRTTTLVAYWVFELF